MKRFVGLFVVLAIVLSALTSCGGGDLQAQKYTEALKLIDSGDYVAAREILIELGDYEDAKTLLGNFRYVLLTWEDSSTDANGEPLGGLNTVKTYSEDGLLVSSVCGNERFEYVYDENKRLIKELCSDGESTWCLCEYAYDEKGNLVKQTNYSSDSGGTIPIRGFEYSYDDRGNMIHKVSLSNYDDELTSLSTFYTQDCTYDENDRLISTVKTQRDGTKERVDYFYDENGLLIREQKKKTDNSVTIFEYIFEYIYDESGKPLRELTDSGIWEYTYDGNGNLVKKQQNTATDSFVYEYTYDENGRLVKEEFEYNGGGETKTVTLFTYDETGTLVRKYREEKDGGKFTHVYDADGNVVEYIYETSHGLVHKSKMTYRLVYSPYPLHERIEYLSYPSFD